MTNVWGICMVRDEEDIVRYSVGNMARQVDYVLVADNGSTDRTREILEGIDNVEVTDDTDVAYYQSRKMSSLAEKARRLGAEWVIPFDADEIWMAKGDLNIREAISELPYKTLVAEAVMFDHVATGIDGPYVNPLRRLQWRRNQSVPMRKVASRAVRGLVINMGNHSVTMPMFTYPAAALDRFVIRHFPYRSVEQFVRKVRNGVEAYNATNFPDSVGAHWRSYGRILETFGEQGIRDIFYKWFYREDPTVEVNIEGEFQHPLTHDPAIVYGKHFQKDGYEQHLGSNSYPSLGDGRSSRYAQSRHYSYQHNRR